MKLKHWILENKLYFLGAAAGAISGFLYWKYIGCLSGSCSITSSPVNSTLYFAFMGALVFGIFKRAPKKASGGER